LARIWRIGDMSRAIMSNSFRLVTELTGVVRRAIIALTVLALALLLPAVEEASAVGGISNSKIVVPSTETVPKGHAEIEPFFLLGLLKNRDRARRFGAGVRLTYGALQNFEIGAGVVYLDIRDLDLNLKNADFGAIAPGIKYRFLDEGRNAPFSLAYQGGVFIPLDGHDTPWIIEPGGLILTKNFTDVFSMDADFVFGIVENDAWTFVSEIGFGYYVRPWFQPVIEAAYIFEGVEGEDDLTIVNLTAGFTSPVTDWLTVIVGVTPDIYTNNINEQVIMSAAFTFLF
jgi:hypothetical protein